MRSERESAVTFSDDKGRSVFNFVLGDGGLQPHARLGADEYLPSEILATATYEVALTAYQAAKNESPDEPDLSEGNLNGRALGLLADNFDYGLALLKINTALYADSANTWDSVGMAYRLAGNKEKAIEFYRKALERDADFPSAKAALAELNSED